MPKAVEKLKQYENSQQLIDSIIEFLEADRKNGYTLDEIFLHLSLNDGVAVKLGSRSVIHNMLHTLASNEQIKSCISNSIEYYIAK